MQPVIGDVEIAIRRAISAPIEAVWELACDISRIPDWVQFTKEMLDWSSPVAALGVTYSERTRSIGPLTTRTRWRITEFEPLRRRVHVGADVPTTKRFVVAIEVEAIDSTSTRLTYTYRYVPGLGPLGRAVSRLTERRTRAAMERSLERFEELLAAR